MASFSVSVDVGGPTITVEATASDYGGTTAKVQVIGNSDGMPVGVGLPTGTTTQTWTISVTSGNTYTVIVTCGGESNVSIVNVP